MMGWATFWPKLQVPTGAARELEWAELFTHFESEVAFKGDQHPGWSPAVFEDNKRGRDNVRHVFALVLDVDGTWTLDGAQEAFGEFYGLIHTSKRHTASKHRFRVVLPLSRPVSAEEYDALWRRMNAHWPGRLDPQAKDASRFWYTPGVLDDGLFETRRLSGHPIDADEWLERPEPVDDQPAATYEAPRVGADVEERARAYIAKMDPAISGSGGHAATWAVALALRGFGLSEDRIFGILKSDYNPRCQPAWSDRELRHKAKEAASRSRVPAGYIVDRDEYRASSGGDARRLPPEAHLPNDEWVPDEGCETIELVDTQTGEVVNHPAPRSPAEPAWMRYGVTTYAETMNKVWESCQEQEQVARCLTGHALVDKIIGGYRRGMVTVLAAETNWGKSSWLVQAVDIAERSDQRVLVVSGEDAEELYGKRLAARRSDLNAQRLRDASLDRDELARLLVEVNRATNEPWFLDGRGRSAEWCSQAVAAILAEADIDLVIVDYLQTFQAKAQDRRNEVSKVGRLFTDAIKRGGASGLLLSQLKRLEEGKRPTKRDIKESGDIENMGEHVLIGWMEKGKDQYGREERKRMLIVDKNKDGPVTDKPIFLPFNEWTASFREVTSMAAEPAEEPTATYGETWD